MGDIALIVLIVIGVALFILAALVFLTGFTDSTGWRPGLDWWTIFFSLLAIGGFAGLGYVLWHR